MAVDQELEGEDRFSSEEQLSGGPTKRCKESQLAKADDFRFSASALFQVDIGSLWPVEVRLSIASFLPWAELVADSLLCRAWRVLELEDSLWQVYFASTWPRMSRRKKASADPMGLPWRALFRAQWSSGSRQEDALEEDWLDFSAAQGMEYQPLAGACTSAPSSHMEKVRHAIQQCREDLRRQGVIVPAEVDASHVCTRHCRFRRLQVEDVDAFLCEATGALHQCQSLPCSCCVASADDFLVCPVSGRCFPKNTTVNEEADVQTCHEWDPELSAAQQVGRWFEQGYSMSEEQALSFFDGQSGGGRRLKRQALWASRAV
mmetsp:Transcript_30723/g.57533  ORF Transcript_30723/g.57533 Transcript_30723/m.57533 type:complete len:318 (+) Transcript_30723:86-1039(+)